MESTTSRAARPLTLEVGAIGLLVCLDAVVGLWAVRVVRRCWLTPDISDLRGTCFDPHGFASTVAFAVAFVAVVALPGLVAVLAAQLVQPAPARTTKVAVLVVLAAGGAFWAATGVLALDLDAASAGLYDPVIAAPKGSSILRPLGHLAVLVGSCCGIVATLLAVATARRARRTGPPA